MSQPEILLIGKVDALNCWMEPGLLLRGRVGVGLYIKLRGAVLTGGQESLAQPLAHPLPLRMTGLSRSSTESQGLDCAGSTFATSELV